MKCPVCNKNDIDLNAVLCPQCDADLTALAWIRELKRKLFSEKTLLVGIIATLALFITFLILFSNSISELAEVKQNNTILVDSITTLNEVHSNIIQVDNKPLNELFYRVKRNDSLWKISNFFFGKGSKYEKIIKDNKLVSDQLVEGQFLKIILD